MLQLHQDYPGFVRCNTAVVVVAPDSPKQLQNYWRDHDLQFTGLADPRRKVLNAYGQGVEWLKLGRMPALFLIDKQAKIRVAHYGSSMADIPNTGYLLGLLEQTNSS